MISEFLLALSVTAFIVSTLAAVAAHLFHEFTRHELEAFARRRGNLQVFDDIIELREELSLGAETLQLINLIVANLCGLAWVVYGQTIGGLNSPQFAAAVGVFGMLTLVTNVWIPWGITDSLASPFLFFTWRFWWLASRLALPLTFGSRWVAAVLNRASGTIVNRQQEEESFEDEIRSMVSEGERDGLLDLDAREMIEGVIELDDTDVGEIMTPKKNIIAIDVDLEWEELIELVVRHNKTRLPVFQGELNEIIGFLHTKDLLAELVRPVSQRRGLRELCREVMLVPESTKVDELLQQFQRQRSHLAIVIDEYDSLAGLVTIEDILEEIVGEIVDETEPEPFPVFRRIDENTVQTPGSTRIDKLNDELGWELPENDEYDTVAGLMMYQLKEIPANRTRISHQFYELEAVGNHRRVVDKVMVRRLPVNHGTNNGTGQCGTGQIQDGY